MLVCALAAPAVATDVVPTVVPGNPTCADLGYSGSFYKFDSPVTVGASPDGAVSITAISGDNTYFDWSALPGVQVHAVIVNGGPQANEYVYYPTLVLLDTGLHAPVNPSGGYAALSHVDFCYNPPVTTPEFPTLALPMMMIIGILGAILVLKR
ncbi:MAG: hypothetical protein JXA08_04970 [Methanomicrobiaceae archaeon]|nr:hypothetical protein [Methanomicrobiaceae archaeon]